MGIGLNRRLILRIAMGLRKNGLATQRDGCPADVRTRRCRSQPLRPVITTACTTQRCSVMKPMAVISRTQMNGVTMGLMSFTNTYFIEYNLLTTAAVISILPILVIFITLQRWVVQAVVMSGLKG